MESSIIFILAVILIIFIALNYYKSLHNKTTSTTTTSSEQNNKNTINSPSCGQTTFGCCPNGVDSRINFYGTNCPGYVPGPGYLPTPQPLPLPPQPLPPQPVLPPPPQPVPPPPHPIYKPHPVGGCAGTRYGCCPNNITAKIDEFGSNCLINKNLCKNKNLSNNI